MAIINLPPSIFTTPIIEPTRKSKFSPFFIPNYAGLATGFTQLLKQGMPFVWDEVAQNSFDDLKSVLVNAPMLHLLDYYRDYFLYLVAVPSTIVMVLVQDDDEGNEHVIYYLSHNLLNTKMHYAHIQKLALVVIEVVQRFQHYFLLRTTIVISECNPMTYILTCQLLGGKYLNGS